MEIWQTPTISDSSTGGNNNGSGGGNGNNTLPGQTNVSSALVSCVGGYYIYYLVNNSTATTHGIKTDIRYRVAFQVLMLPVSSSNPVTQWETELGSGNLLKVCDLSTQPILVPITSKLVAGAIVDSQSRTMGITGGTFSANIKFTPPRQPDDDTKKWRVFFFSCDPDESTGEVNNKALYHKLINLATFSPETLKFNIDVVDVNWGEAFIAPVSYLDDWSSSYKRTTTSIRDTAIENTNFAVQRDFDFEGPIGTHIKYVVQKPTVASINTQKEETSWQSIGGTENVKNK